MINAPTVLQGFLIFFIALASWCARTGGRRPFSEGATAPCLLMVAHQLASASEVTSL